MERAAQQAPSPLQPWRWATLLGLALLAPVALPAGGGERRLPQVRRRESLREPLLSQVGADLQVAPRRPAPVLAEVDAGQPLRLLRSWWAPDGRRWLRVEARLQGGRPARGWLAG
ncbi:MAG: SH3 domain-containing protein [Prochlorococcaceae cyanobacterium]